jgi:hypothetical protein
MFPFNTIFWAPRGVVGGGTTTFQLWISSEMTDKLMFSAVLANYVESHPVPLVGVFSESLSKINQILSAIFSNEMDMYLSMNIIIKTSFVLADDL